MFGISAAELFVILLVGMLVIPVKHWPEVAKFLARAVKFVKNIIAKVTDAGNDIKQQIELEKPIDDVIQTTKNNMIDTFSTLRQKHVDRAGIDIGKKAKSVKQKSGAKK